MIRSLLIGLVRGQGRRFRVGVGSSGWEIVSNGYAPADLAQLNQALDAVHTAYPAARFVQSFSKFINRLRSFDGFLASDRDVALYFRIGFPEGTSIAEIDAIGRTLKRVSVLVDLARTTGGFSSTTSTCPDTQVYLDPATDGGHDVRFAWDLPGGRGDNVWIGVIESGYQRDHADLPPPDTPPSPEVPQVDYVEEPAYPSREHGTATLGILVGLHAESPLGIAPNAYIRVSSIDLNRSEPSPHATTTTNAGALSVLAAIDDLIGSPSILTSGDVLLLQQGSYDPDLPDENNWPMDIFDDIRSCLREAETLGITTVLPAGNGARLLDRFVGAVSDYTRSDAALLDDDSTAVSVGAGHSVHDATPRSRVSLTNWGYRVNCQSWGECIRTLREYEEGEDLYQSNWGDTSGASAIVAGMVAVIQSLHTAAYLGPLDPRVIREKLSNVALGLSQQPSSDNNHIGPQPDLRLILRDCALLPDVFVRDNFEDDGTEPSPTDLIWYSPDIVPRRAVTDSALLTGANWDVDQGQEIMGGAESYVYLRTENRGPFDDQPKIDLYWSHPATFLYPGLWNHIDYVEPLVPKRNVDESHRVVTPAIRWLPPTDTDQPCLIAVVTSQFDIHDPLSGVSAISDYIQFIRDYNNLAHRNVVVLPEVTGLAFARFFVPTPETEWTQFSSLKIVSNLPPQARLFVGLPESREDAFADTVDLSRVVRETRKDLLSRLPRDERKSVRDRIRKPAGDRRAIRGGPDEWLVGTPRELVFRSLPADLSAGRGVHFTIGVDMPQVSDPSRYGIQVQQYWLSDRVGQVNIRFDSRRRR